MKKFNVLGCNDQFFNIFLNTWLLFASMGMAWINNAVPGRFGINYYMCTGEDPRDYDFLAPKVSFDSIYIMAIRVVEFSKGRGVQN